MSGSGRSGSFLGLAAFAATALASLATTFPHWCIIIISIIITFFGKALIVFSILIITTIVMVFIIGRIRAVWL